MLLSVPVEDMTVWIGHRKCRRDVVSQELDVLVFRSRVLDIRSVVLPSSQPLVIVKRNIVYGIRVDHGGLLSI